MRDARTSSPLAPIHPFKLDLWGRFFVWFLDPPPKIRFRVPRGFAPTADPSSAATALPAFLASQDSLLEAITSGEGLPLDRIIIPDAFSSLVRYSLWSSFCATAAHHRRHVWQAERVAQALGG